MTKISQRGRAKGPRRGGHWAITHKDRLPWCVLDRMAYEPVRYYRQLDRLFFKRPDYKDDWPPPRRGPDRRGFAWPAPTCPNHPSLEIRPPAAKGTRVSEPRRQAKCQEKRSRLPRTQGLSS